MRDRSPTARTICRIGPLTLDPDSDVLLRDGVPLPLGRRAVALLRRLARSPGEIVGKDALYDAAWPGQIVEESNLSVQISQLRRTLRAEADGGGWIETLPRRGYRFTGPAAWQTASSPGIVPVPRAPSLVSNIPVAVPLHFTGRVAELAALHAALTIAAPGPAIVVLHGLRGVGKTILAAAYARQHAPDYRATWWLRAETVPTLRADLAALAARMGWAPADAAESTACAAALDRLRDDGDGLLLIHDNAIDAAALRPYLPGVGRARIVVTSNAPAWRAYATPIEISQWPASVGADYLMARTGRIEARDDAEALSKVLDGLPLAHEQAAAYIESLELSFAEYLRRFDAAPARLLDDPTHAPADYHGGLPVAKAFHLAIAQAATMHPAAKPLLRYAAVLASEPIPIFLFREGSVALGEPLVTHLAGDGLDHALASLRGFALISREAIPDERDPTLRTDCLRLHRLVRQVATATLSPEAVERTRADLIAALAAVYPPLLFNIPSTWPRVRRLDALALALVAPPAIIPDGAELSACLVLDGVASFRHGALAAFSQARPLFERELELAESKLGPAHPVTGLALNNLALLLRDHGDPAAARPLYVRALAVREAALGPNHPDTAVCLNNLANVLNELDDPAAARPLFERAREIWEATHGENHWQTARGMNNVARILHRLGDLDAARALHQRTLAIRASALGAGHPDTANSLKNLALLQLDLGDPNEARALGERALAIDEAFLGPDHPETASIRATLARFMLALGEPAAALPIAERALGALSATLAAGAPFTRAAAAVVADCLDALGRATDGADIRRRHLLAAPPH
jgi:DNA-binding winged helix-turn-helix (wHTH) protein/tetratricopeptide (TPR) repeat protein